MEEGHFVSSGAKSQPLVVMMNCQFYRKNGWSGWPLWGGATASATSISPNGLH